MKIASSGWRMHGGGDLHDLALLVGLFAKVLGSETRLGALIFFVA